MFSSLHRFSSQKSRQVWAIGVKSSRDTHEPSPGVQGRGRRRGAPLQAGCDDARQSCSACRGGVHAWVRRKEARYGYGLDTVGLWSYGRPASAAQYRLIGRDWSETGGGFGQPGYSLGTVWGILWHWWLAGGACPRPCLFRPSLGAALVEPWWSLGGALVGRRQAVTEA